MHVLIILTSFQILRARIRKNPKVGYLQSSPSLHIHKDINISLAGQVAAQTARAGGDFPARVQRETGANATTTFHYLPWSFHSLFQWFQAPILAEIRREVSELKRKEAVAEAVAPDKIPGIWTKFTYCVKGSFNISIHE